MIVFEERNPNLEYKDKKSSIEVMLSGVDSAIVTKVVNKWQEWKDVEARLAEARQQAAILAQEAREHKNTYESMIRDLEEKYFDVIADSAKTKMIRTMSFLVKISKHSEPHESSETDYEGAFNEAIEVFNIPIETVKELLANHTQTELIYPRTRLYEPVPLKDGKDLNESLIGDAIKKILNNLKIKLNKLLNKLKVCDSIIDRLEEKYL